MCKVYTVKDDAPMYQNLFIYIHPQDPTAERFTEDCKEGIRLGDIRKHLRNNGYVECDLVAEFEMDV